MVFEYAKECRAKAGEKKVLIVHRKKTHAWSKAASNQKDTASTKIITAEKLIRWINYMLDNLYVEVAGVVLQQVIGIPMGTSCYHISLTLRYSCTSTNTGSCMYYACAFECAH